MFCCFLARNLIFCTKVLFCILNKLRVTEFWYRSKIFEKFGDILKKRLFFGWKTFFGGNLGPKSKFCHTQFSANTPEKISWKFQGIWLRNTWASGFWIFIFRLLRKSHLKVENGKFDQKMANFWPKSIFC